MGVNWIEWNGALLSSCLHALLTEIFLKEKTAACPLLPPPRSSPRAPAVFSPSCCVCSVPSPTFSLLCARSSSLCLILVWVLSLSPRPHPQESMWPGLAEGHPWWSFIRSQTVWAPSARVDVLAQWMDDLPFPNTQRAHQSVPAPLRKLNKVLAT